MTLIANDFEPVGQINSRYSGWTTSLDVKATRAFRWNNLNMELQLWVINLFDADNVTTVWQSTGLANSTGWLETETGQDFVSTYSEANDSSNMTGEEKYRLRENDPNNYGVPRQIRAGLKISF